MSDFEKIKDELKNKLIKAKDSKELEITRSEIFSKNGLINSEFKKLGSLSPEEKKKVASKINTAKQELTKLLNEKVARMEFNEIDERVKKEKNDVTLPEKILKLEKYIQYHK